jgi:uncharacterized SAM-binding protein YcdF (DUF218 family)
MRKNEITPHRHIVFRPRFRTRKILIVAFLIAMSVSIWFSRGMILAYVAEQWVVSDDIRPADAVVILGGGIDTRPFAAAEDYRKGLTHKLLVANPGTSNAESVGVLPSHSAINRGVLIKLGVPEVDIETLGTGLTTTFDEARALRDWAICNHAQSVIVPTEAFSTRRVRWAMTQALAGTGTAIQIQILHDPEYSYADWWKTDKGFIALQNEVMKYLYYRYRYSHNYLIPSGGC